MNPHQTFHWPVRIYYESTDAGGVVYHAEYLKFFERARTEWLRQLGFEQPELQTNDGVLFVVHKMEIQYARPARFNENLSVVSTLKELGRCRFVFEQTLVRETTRLTQAKVEVACVSANDFRPMPLPTRIRQQFESVLS